MNWKLLLVALGIFSACGGDTESQVCNDISCSGHGSCANSQGTAQCNCEDGYVADGLTCLPNVIVIENDLTEPSTWKTGHIYYIQQSDFSVETALDIQPGVIVKFHSGKGSKLRLRSGGTINAKGTADQPIIFTSYKDDAHGGDTNNDGSGTTPASADWAYIETNNNNGSVFEFCHFLYGGSNSFGTLDLSGSKSTVKNCLFAHNVGGKYDGDYEGALNASGSKAGTIIENNTFYDNQVPLSIDVSFSLGDSNIFHNPDNESETNQYNGVFVQPSGNVETAITWQETEVAFVIHDNDLRIDADASLTLAENVVVKFTAGSKLKYSGENIKKYNLSGVVFTSFKDDTQKGDTNGDGNASSPVTGDWLGIYRDKSGNSGYETWTNILYNKHP
jgi:hypothetical protein